MSKVSDYTLNESYNSPSYSLVASSENKHKTSTYLFVY